MTHNQLTYQANQEQARHNYEVEKETARYQQAVNYENTRHNTKMENLQNEKNIIDWKLGTEANYLKMVANDINRNWYEAQERIQSDYNKSYAKSIEIQGLVQAETNRHNLFLEGETAKHNRELEEQAKRQNDINEMRANVEAFSTGASLVTNLGGAALIGVGVFSGNVELVPLGLALMGSGTGAGMFAKQLFSFS